MSELSSVPLWIWIVFNAVVVMLVVLDLGIMHKKQRAISVPEALISTMFWVCLAILFNVAVWWYLGKEKALDFLTGYLIEKTLSVDNLFVFLMVFDYFNTPEDYQHKVLFWGILGAIVMRALFIFFGVELVGSFHWILYLFGIFLLYAAVKMAKQGTRDVHPDDNWIIKKLKTYVPVTKEYCEDKFFVKKEKRWNATPLFVALIAVETTDLIFAIDSIPAMMSITLDPFIIYTANVFAILGLRSLFFALAGIMPRFHLLRYGLTAVLAFVALKMLLADYITVPIEYALGFTILALAVSIVASLMTTPRQHHVA